MLIFNHIFYTINPLAKFKNNIDNTMIISIRKKYYYLKDLSYTMIKLALSVRTTDILSTRFDKSEIKKTMNYLLLSEILVANISESYEYNKNIVLFRDFYTDDDHYVFIINNKMIYKITEQEYNMINKNTIPKRISILDDFIFKNIIFGVTKNKHFKIELDIQEDKVYNYYLLFSYACNLNCTYCFENNVDKNAHKDINAKLVNYIMENHTIDDHIVISFYGGEPLLLENFEMITNITSNLHNSNIKYRMITNGINIELFRYHCKSSYYQISEFVITIDGPKYIHDLRRKDSHGNGSFLIILDSIKLLIQDDLNVTIRSNINEDNYEYMEELILTFQESNIDLSKLNIALYPVTNNKADNLDISNSDIYLCKISQDLNKKYHFKSFYVHSRFYFFLNSLESHAPFYDLIYNDCALNHNFVVNSDGKVYCCNEAMGVKNFIVEKNFKMRKIKSIPYDIHCKRDCEFFELCLGGCPLKRYFNLPIKVETCPVRLEYHNLLRNALMKRIENTI